MMPIYNTENKVVANIKYFSPTKSNKYLGHTKIMDGQNDVNDLIVLLKGETFFLYTNYLRNILLINIHSES